MKQLARALAREQESPARLQVAVLTPQLPVPRAQQQQRANWFHQALQR